MIHAESSILIGRPVEDVFVFVDDFSKSPSWLESCAELKQVSPGAKAAGTKLHYLYRRGGHMGEMAGEVTAYDNGSRLEMQYRDQMFEVEVRFRFSPVEGGTTVTHSVGITPKTFAARLMSRIIRKVNCQQVENNLSRLKGLLEQSN